MGLDVAAYGKAEFVRARTDRDDWDDDMSYVFTLRPFAARIRDMKEGFYRVDGDMHSFRAGSYSGYNTWRDYLAKAIHGKSAADVWDDASSMEEDALKGHDMPPFYELIHFADNEGCIGTSVCKKLYKDFLEYEDKFVEWVLANTDEHTAEYAVERYHNWMEAFEIASRSGFVAFH